VDFTAARDVAGGGDQTCADPEILSPVCFCLFAWGLMALSAQIGYIVPEQ